MAPGELPGRGPGRYRPGSPLSVCTARTHLPSSGTHADRGRPSVAAIREISPPLSGRGCRADEVAPPGWPVPGLGPKSTMKMKPKSTMKMYYSIIPPFRSKGSFIQFFIFFYVKERKEEEKMSVNEDGRSVVETSKAERSVWLMKCPPVVARSWQSAASKAAAVSSSSDPSAAHPVVAKVVLSLDPLEADESSSLQFKMELAQNEVGNTPKSYSLNMFKDFVPGMVGLVPSGSKDKKKVAPTNGTDTKRTRRDHRELENILFKLFERQPNWALRQLVKEADQPEGFFIIFL